LVVGTLPTQLIIHLPCVILPRTLHIVTVNGIKVMAVASSLPFLHPIPAILCALSLLFIPHVVEQL
jgi:hypothetical protein